MGEPQEVSQVVDNEDEVEWKVKEILAHWQQGKGWQYLIKWIGFPDYENSWEPLEHLTNTQVYIDKYNQTHGLKNQSCQQHQQ